MSPLVAARLALRCCRRASSRCSRAGTSSRSGASRGSSTALLRTANAVTPDARGRAACWTSLIVFAVVYAIVFGAGIWYLFQLVRTGPQPHEPAPDTDEGDKTPARPLSVAGEPTGGARVTGVLAARGVVRRDRLRRADVRAARRLRARPGHPRAVRRGRAPARPHDEHRRADLGRQRNLAGARRRGPARGVPEGVRDGAVGAVPAGAADADRAGVPRRRVRVPLQGACARKPCVGRGVRARARCSRRSRRA